MNINEMLQTLNNYDLERSTLSILLAYPEKLEECEITKDMLVDTTLSTLLNTMIYMKNKGQEVNTMSIINFAASKGKMDAIGGTKLISELASESIGASQFESFQKLIKENHLKRQTILLMQKTMSEVLESDIDTLQEGLFSELSRITDSSKKDDDDGNVKEALVNVLNDMQTEKEGITGASTGFTLLDEYLDGLKKQKLIIIGARPGAGKTALIMNMLQTHSVINKQPSIMFNMEMSKEELLKRMISSIGLINSGLMRNPVKRFKDKEWESTMSAVGLIDNSKFRLFDKPSVDLSYIKSKCRKMKRDFPNEHILVFIDYLQLIKGNPKLEGNKNLQIGEISTALKVLSRELDCTVVCLSQLGREVEKRQDKRPIMSDIRDSGQVEQDADIIGMLYRDDYYNPETSEKKNIIEFIIAKNREGRTGTVDMLFQKEFSKISNIKGV